MDFYSNYEPYEGVYHLKHYGVLGMKWGVRHDPRPSDNGIMSRMRKKRITKMNEAYNKRVKKKMMKTMAKYPEFTKKYLDSKEKYNSLYSKLLDDFRNNKTFRNKVLSKDLNAKAQVKKNPDLINETDYVLSLLNSTNSIPPETLQAWNEYTQNYNMWRNLTGQSRVNPL